MRSLLLAITAVFLFSGILNTTNAQTIAAWPFDEQQGIYPSSVINDVSDNDYPLVIGMGGMIVEGRFGNGLSTTTQPEIKLEESEDEVRFGLTPLPTAEGRTVPPLTWFNAHFTALMTSGENHLRKQVGFPQATSTKLNLGRFDWTIEFYFKNERETGDPGVVFELGTGPRGENDRVTSLLLSKELDSFVLINGDDKQLVIPSDAEALRASSGNWHHYAFVYDAQSEQLSHYVDGELQALPEKMAVSPLPVGDEDYFSVGRDALWNNALPGVLDELRFSEGQLYSGAFTSPVSFSPVANTPAGTEEVVSGPPLLFDGPITRPVALGSRRHLFIDGSMIDDLDGAKFVANPPTHGERVIDNIEGEFRKHLNVMEDEDGVIRIYNAVSDDYLAVRTSTDGVNFTEPELPDGEYLHHKNVVVHAPSGMGNVFIDPNAAPERRWKYISDYHRRGIFLFTSPDGWHFEREKMYVLPFRSGSQSNIFYDEQQQSYISYHRTDFALTATGDTERNFVVTTTDDVDKPWPFEPVSQKQVYEWAENNRERHPIPWYLDNGPLTPGGFSIEYPWAFRPDDYLDPVNTDIYVPKAMKYPWAPDTYLAFPVIYFHYEGSADTTRLILYDKERNLGSGPLETQLSVSRNGYDWKRYPRPAYVGIGERDGREVHTAYIAQGMIRRGEEIWQYYFGETQYHSSHFQDPGGRGVYRLVQRLDGFVSIDSPYDREIEVITKPFVFSGDHLFLNIDTHAAGYAQVGILDADGNEIKGYEADYCVYINGDFINKEVEWLWSGTDVSELEGKVVRLKLRMRGSKLYAMQFADSIEEVK